MSRLLKQYQKEILPQLKKKFKLDNELAVPRVMKVVVNMGVGDIASDKTALEKAEQTLAAITGQRPLVCRAKRSIADFGIQQGDPIGLKVTLRGRRMYQFLDKLFSLVLPQVKDFQGVKRQAFDGQANYTLGLTEQIVFPEVDYDKIDKVRGLEITIVTSTEDKSQGRELLKLLGMPFAKEESDGQKKSSS